MLESRYIYSKMNYFTITLLTFSFCAHYFENTVFSCSALMLDEGDPCKDPAVACEELGPGAIVYDPEDCHQSYACIEDYTGHVVPSDQPFTCPDDLTFDYEIQNCSSKITSCNKACVNKGCYLRCTDETDGYVADINDCNIYYFCYQGIISAPANCPESEPYFDGSGCTDKEYLCCDACTVYCARNDSGKNIADPFDCTAYYTCESGESYPSEDEHFNCNEGQQFDIDQGICTDTTETCENICTYISTTAKSTTKPTERTTFFSQSTTITEVTTNPQSTIASHETSTTFPRTTSQPISTPHESSTTILITTSQPVTSESTETNSASQTPTTVSSESPEPSPTNAVSTITSQKTTKPQSTRSGSTETPLPTNPGPKINNKQQNLNQHDLSQQKHHSQLIQDRKQK
ncbi:UNVERIFIED_CONTAM: hypothetical protein RMT77_010492 [Armadillidium vulgare]